MRSTLMIAAALALGSSACGSSPTSRTPSTQTLTGSGFKAAFPASWTKTSRSIQGATEYELSSHGTLSNVGIPAAGAIGITVQVLPFSVLEAHGAPNLDSLSPDQLVSGLVGTPKGATGVATAKAVHPVTLAGDTGSGISFTYSNSGTANVQEDVVDRHGTTAYFIELDTEPTLQSRGEAALTAFIASWAWSA